MSEDAERQPLLRDVNQGLRSSEPSNRFHKSSRNRVTAGIIAFIVLLTTTIFLGLIYVKSVLPDDVSFKEHIGDITNVEINDISFNGWTYIDEKRYYKLGVKSSVWLDYEAGSAVSERQKKLISFAGTRIMKELCFDLNSLDTFKQENDTDVVSLGKIIIPNTTCINIQQNSTTDLDLLVLVKPNTEQLIPILKQIWEKKYDGLNLWSSMDLKLKKRVFSHEIVLLSINKAKLYWRDFGLWKSVIDTLRHLSAEIYDTIERIEINSINLKEIEDGYDISCSIGVPNPLSSTCNKLGPGLLISPGMQWQTTFPGCRNENGIKLDNVVVHSPELTSESVSKPFINITLDSTLIGELPNEFLNHVCASDDSNVITPLSKLIKQLLDPKYLINLEVTCTAVDSKNYPNTLLEDYTALLPYLFTPLSVNYTVDVNNIVQEVGTRGIKLQWSTDLLGRKRLNVKGKIVAKVQIPFYQLKQDTTFSMQRIKGRTKLYHNDVHMLTVPLDSWTKCISNVVIDEDKPEKSYFDVSFDIDNDQVIIAETLALTHCINEVVFKGESTIFLKGKLDLMVATSIGDIVLLALPGEGSAVVRP